MPTVPAGAGANVGGLIAATQAVRGARCREAAYGGQIDLRARRRRIWGGVERPALVHENQVAVTVEAGADQDLRIAQRVAAGAAGELHDRIGRGRPQRRRHNPDRQANRAPFALARFSAR